MPRKRNAKMTNNDFGKIRSLLAQNGVSQAEITVAIGSFTNNRTREEISNELKKWLKTRPKQ